MVGVIKKHWSVDTKELQKDPVAYNVWKLEQRINFGIGERKININNLKKYWGKLKIDPYKKKALALALD